MWQRLYLQRLKTDINLWIERGWVTPAHAEAIIKQATTSTVRRSMASILAMLGVVLIGFAAMSFVAANWNDISKPVKLVMIFSAMWLAYGGAFYLKQHAHENFAQAAVLLGLALFGAGIMLVAQIYHIQTDDPGGVLAWALAALAGAAILPSRPALALAFLLAGTWTAFTYGLNEHAVHWSFILVWAPAMWLSLWLSWTPAMHLGLLSLVLWFGLYTEAFAEKLHLSDANVIGFYGLIALALWLKGVALSKTMARLGAIMEHYGIILAFGLLWVMQFATAGQPLTTPALVLLALMLVILIGLAIWALMAAQIHLKDLAGIAVIAAVLAVQPFLPGTALTPWAYVALLLGLAAWLIAYGSARESRFTVNLGFVAFGGETLYVYFEALGSLLGTAAFFLLGGVLLIAGSFIMERMRRRIVGGVGTSDRTGASA
ncbi:MAG: DUF2157 domain-containing protein [Rhizobiales bacterium]|nr:DUF2157 domain-containing protein [Hyphomicrobiales bacterium]